MIHRSGRPHRSTPLIAALLLVGLVGGAGAARSDDLHVIGASPDGARVALFAVKADLPRGFHEHTLEIRTVPDGAVVETAPIVPPSRRSRWSKAGEFELYRLDVERARRDAIARVRSELGFAPLTSVLGASPLTASRSGAGAPGAAPDPRQPTDPPAVSTLRLHGRPVDALVRNEDGSAAIVLRHLDREVTLDARPLDVAGVPDGKASVVYRWFGVREAWTDPAGASLLLVVDTYVPTQRSFAARSVLVMAPLAPILDGLGVATPVGESAPSTPSTPSAPSAPVVAGTAVALER